MSSFSKIIFGVIVFLFMSCTESNKRNIIQEKNPLKNYLSSDTLRPWYLRGIVFDEESSDDVLFKLIKSKFYNSIEIKVNLYEQTGVCGECHRYQLMQVTSQDINIIIPLNDVVSYSFLSSRRKKSNNEALKIINGLKMPKELNSLINKVGDNGNFSEIENFIDNLFTDFIIVSRDLDRKESELFWKIRTKNEIDSLNKKYFGFSKEYFSIKDREKIELPRRSSMYYSYNNSIYRVILSESLEGEFNLDVELLYLEHFEDYLF